MNSAPQRILVLDDEPGIGRLVAAALEHHVTEVFTQPSAALQRCREAPFDFVFCDFSMPEMTGIAFHDALLGIQPDLARRFVLMTGSAPCAAIGDFLARTEVKLLQKPFELRVLVGLVEGGRSPDPTPPARVANEEPADSEAAMAGDDEALAAATAHRVDEHARACPPSSSAA